MPVNLYERRMTLRYFSQYQRMMLELQFGVRELFAICTQDEQLCVSCLVYSFVCFLCPCWLTCVYLQNVTVYHIQVAVERKFHLGRHSCSTFLFYLHVLLGSLKLVYIIV